MPIMKTLLSGVFPGRWIMAGFSFLKSSFDLLRQQITFEFFYYLLS